MAHAVDTDLIRVTGDVARVKFDGINERKLKPTHGYIRKAIAACSKELGRSVSVGEMATDPFSGHAFLVWAMLAPALKSNQQLSVDDADKLIESFYKQGGKPEELRNALVVILATYLNAEVATEYDEDDGPNAPTPEAPGTDSDD